MSVRGSKGKIILYIGGACSLIFVILLYQNASQRLEEVEKSYQRCHLNEESLSAQLQVNLEYKVRLEKSLQQQKSDHAQIKEELKNKLEEERQGREREKLESINKFTALQQQYKFLQSQHEDVNLEFGKLRQLQLSDVEEKSRLENLIQRLKDELRLVKENKNNEIEQLKEKYDRLVKENTFLKESNKGSVDEKQGNQIKLPDKLPLNTSIYKAEENENSLQQPRPGMKIVSSASSKPSTLGKKEEQELFPSGHNAYMKTSTPMINPDAINSQDKMLSPGPVTQPKLESIQNFQQYEHKENVGAKPEEMAKEGRSEQGGPAQGVLRAPDILKDFQHVPVIQSYKEKLQQEMNVNDNNDNNNNNENNLEAIMYEKQPLRKPELQHAKAWKGGEHPNMFFIRQPVGNEIPKNPEYHYQGDYNDGRKVEGEDDDDVDPAEYRNEKDRIMHQQLQMQMQPLQQQNHHQQQQEERPNLGVHVQMPFQNNHESVMIQPK